jgi:hypothetical protein
MPIDAAQQTRNRREVRETMTAFAAALVARDWGELSRRQMVKLAREYTEAILEEVGPTVHALQDSGVLPDPGSLP